MTIITDYLTLQKDQQDKYGERTVVLMAIGSFYEIYEYDPSYCSNEEAKIDKEGKIWNENIGHAVALSTVLNAKLTQEDKNQPYAINNPFKIGFPIVAYEKNKPTLLANDFTIVRVDQEKGAIKGHVTRHITEVCSPYTEICDATLTRSTSNIAVIYIEYQHGIGSRYENFLITTGIAVVDIITGTNRVCEFHSKLDDQVHAIQELYRFLISHYPRELIIHIDDIPTTVDAGLYTKYLEKMLDTKRFDRTVSYINRIPPEYKKVSYQIEYLNKLFMRKEFRVPGLNLIQARNDKIIEELGLERMKYGLLAYMILIQHCHSYNPDIITKLEKPDLQWIDSESHLILTHNAILQLDLISNKPHTKQREIDSLMCVLDQNQTNLGRRMLHGLLQNPMLRANEIQVYYDMVEDMLSIKIENEPLWLVLDRHLKELPDIARLHRKLEIKLITPKELAILYRAYLKIIQIYTLIWTTRAPTLTKQLLNAEDSTGFNQFLVRFTPIINFQALECCYLESSAESDNEWLEFSECPINPGSYDDIDKCNAQLVQAEKMLQQIVDHLNEFLKGSKGKDLEFKCANKKPGAKKSDPTGVILSTTTAKANLLMNSPINTDLCGRLQLMTYTSNEQLIKSDKITALTSVIDTNKMWLRKRLRIIYFSLLDEMISKYKFYAPIAHLIAKLDLIHSYAKVSEKYNYYRPIIVDEGDISFIEAVDMRHPIIENIIDGVYVANDIRLGHGETISTGEKRFNGMLLYGLNMSGKSSYVKSVALNIIMAQIGCYVPSHLRYKPYSKIITRLSGNDNIFAGLSSFAVEMNELRTILRQADKNTLVVGDELCHGTENCSATSITTSAILSLVKTNASFIFATHLHDLVDLPYIKNLDPYKLRVCHLTTHKDPATSYLIYDRKLHDGPGPTNYGILVTESLELPKDFIEKAYEIVNYITEAGADLVNTKSSRYNSRFFVDACTLCGVKSNLHVHHIIEQNMADNNGFVLAKTTIENHEVSLGKLHKNKLDNLIVLCKDCHTNLHSTKQELETISTTKGKLIRLKQTVN